MFARNGKDSMDSLIGADTQIDGHLLFRGGLRIDGQVRGNVIAAAGQHSYLVVGEHGRIDGEVRCAHLVVSGQINGPVHVSELLEIQPKARIVGEVHYKVMEMHGGALVSGCLEHQDGGDSLLHLSLSEA
ncbi:MAG TPA: cell shape determination protein CcmA [Janthinobacterium sp.]|nr:cell shape determination protein CcmA [Janthinobacterium sp.]